MGLTRLRIVALLVIAWILSISVSAQGNVALENFRGTYQQFDGVLRQAGDELRVIMSLSAEDTVYVYAEGTQNLTPHLRFTDAMQVNNLRDDLTPTNRNQAGLAYTVTRADNYMLKLIAAEGSGGYRLWISLNDSAPLDDTAFAQIVDVASADTSGGLGELLGSRDDESPQQESESPSSLGGLLGGERDDPTTTESNESSLGGILSEQADDREESATQAESLGELLGGDTSTTDDPSALTTEVLPVEAIRAGEIETYEGTFVNSDDEIIITLEGLNAGDTIYIYAAGVGFVDTYIYVLDMSQETVYAEDDDSGGGYNSALSYTVTEAGDYKVGLITINSIGEYQLTVGVNAPQVIDNLAASAPDFGEFDCSLAERGDRPVLSGPTRLYEGETFLIHYTLTGRDATTVAYVEEMASAIERSLDIQFNRLGWRQPPADCGEGGDERLDVYVVDISEFSAIGYASPENVVGNNPNTTETEVFAAYSYLAIENDMDGIPEAYAIDLMKTTAAHEIHHNIQFGYDVNDEYFGFYEAGASWIETLVYPTVTDVFDHTSDVFRATDVCVGVNDRRSLRIYGEWVMVDSFTRDLGVESYQFIWEYMSTDEGLPGFYEALDELGTSPQEVIERMAIRNLLLDYALAKRFNHTVTIEAEVVGTGTVRPNSNGVQELGVDYVEISREGVYNFELVRSPDIALFVVGIDETTNVGTVYDLGQAGTVDTTLYDRAYIIVLNTIAHTNSNDCQFSTWSIRVSDGADNAITQADNEAWDATQFIAPR